MYICPTYTNLHYTNIRIILVKHLLLYLFNFWDVMDDEFNCQNIVLLLYAVKLYSVFGRQGIRLAAIVL